MKTEMQTHQTSETAHIESDAMYRCPVCFTEYDGGEHKETCKNIVSAVNAHDELVAACKIAERALDGLRLQCDDREWTSGQWQDLPEALLTLTTALSKAGGAK